MKESKVWTRIFTNSKIKAVKLGVKMKMKITHPVSEGKTNIGRYSMIQARAKVAVCGQNGAESYRIPNP